MPRVRGPYKSGIPRWSRDLGPSVRFILVEKVRGRYSKQLRFPVEREKLIDAGAARWNLSAIPFQEAGAGASLKIERFRDPEVVGPLVHVWFTGNEILGDTAGEIVDFELRLFDHDEYTAK